MRPAYGPELTCWTLWAGPDNGTPFCPRTRQPSRKGVLPDPTLPLPCLGQPFFLSGLRLLFFQVGMAPVWLTLDREPTDSLDPPGEPRMRQQMGVAGSLLDDLSLANLAPV